MTSLGDAFTRVSRVARQRALVLVVSDFRGPRDWRSPLVRLTARHEVVAVEIRDRREQELPDVGHLWLVDPETGRRLRVDTGRRKLRERFATAAEAERASLASELRSLGVRPRRPADCGRLAAAVRVVRGRWKEAAVSFASPSFLWLLLIPLAAALYVLAQRRRVRYAARFTNLDLLANVVDASPGRRRHLPAVFALAASPRCCSPWRGRR